MTDNHVSIHIHSSLSDIDAGKWNVLVTGQQPFLKHEFLTAMETHGCVDEYFGWRPAHIGIYQDQRPVAAMPLYRKLNSYGEFVFDHTWQEAWRWVGLSYFPKLVSVIL
ncbi:MAG TPA: GNAT family N-acetyltransferase, partial [Thiolapillus brandeum]|nr:GNAT family N-acetyltransferase [Thiolapillus brandeum]